MIVCGMVQWKIGAMVQLETGGNGNDIGSVGSIDGITPTCPQVTTK